MKKSEGMMPPVLVFEDDGQNGDFGPAPSSVIETGTTLGIVDAVLRRAEAQGCGQQR